MADPWEGAADREAYRRERRRRSTGIGCAVVLLVILGLYALGSASSGPSDASTAAVAQLDADPLAGAAASAAPKVPELIEAYLKESSRKLCAEQWPDDLALRGGCMRNAQDGYRSFRSIAAKYKDIPDMQRALAGCLDDWTADGATDFALLGGCARNNEDALKDL